MESKFYDNGLHFSFADSTNWRNPAGITTSIGQFVTSRTLQLGRPIATCTRIYIVWCVHMAGGHTHESRLATTIAARVNMTPRQ